MEMMFSHLVISGWSSAWEICTIQDKIATWAAHQPVKNETAVEFPTPQEDMSRKGLEDYAEAL
jgi:hypothetical protein